MGVFPQVRSRNPCVCGYLGLHRLLQKCTPGNRFLVLFPLSTLSALPFVSTLPCISTPFHLPFSTHPSMSGLKVKDVFLDPKDFDPRQTITPYPISRENETWTQSLTPDEFKSFWHQERIAFQFEHRSEGGYNRAIPTDKRDHLLPTYQSKQALLAGQRQTTGALCFAVGDTALAKS